MELIILIGFIGMILSGDIFKTKRQLKDAKNTGTDYVFINNTGLCVFDFLNDTRDT